MLLSHPAPGSRQDKFETALQSIGYGIGMLGHNGKVYTCPAIQYMFETFREI